MPKVTNTPATPDDNNIVGTIQYVFRAVETVPVVDNGWKTIGRDIDDRIEGMRAERESARRHGGPLPAIESITITLNEEKF